MPEVDENIMAFVEMTLNEDPTIQLEDLFERAKRAIPSSAKLSKRQFNARYPLQVKRRRALAAKGAGAGGKALKPAQTRKRKRPSTPVGGPRDSVRHVLLQFATDITAAEERKDLVKVLAGVDHYVDEVLKGVSGG